MAASQCFNENTDVLMLTTNLIRKDLNSASMYESGVALGGLSCFVTPDLARDLANDVVTLVNYIFGLALWGKPRTKLHYKPKHAAFCLLILIQGHATAIAMRD